MISEQARVRDTVRDLVTALSERRWKAAFGLCADNLELWLPQGEGWICGRVQAEQAVRRFADRAPEASLQLLTVVAAADCAVAELALATTPGVDPQPLTLVLELTGDAVARCRAYTDPRALSGIVPSGSAK